MTLSGLSALAEPPHIPHLCSHGHRQQARHQYSGTACNIDWEPRPATRPHALAGALAAMAAAQGVLATNAQDAARRACTPCVYATGQKRHAGTDQERMLGQPPRSDVLVPTGARSVQRPRAHPVVCSMTSGAIQQGVPTKVLRAMFWLPQEPPRSMVAATPKSASITCPLASIKMLPACTCTAQHSSAPFVLDASDMGRIQGLSRAHKAV